MSYSNQVIENQQCIWLQFYGFCPAKPAKDFAIGEFMKWNGGSESKILAVASQSPKSITFLIEWKSGDQYKTGERRLIKDRLVAIGSGKYY